jgi:O-antigen ligase
MNYPPRAGQVVIEPQRTSWLRQLGWGFPVLVIFSFLVVWGILDLISQLQLEHWEMTGIILLGPAALVILILGTRQAMRGVRVLGHQLVWWHWLWLLIFISQLVFRIRDAADAQSLPIDGYALLRLAPEGIVGVWILVRFLGSGSALRKSFAQGLVGALTIYSLVCLLSAVWSVQSTWTLYKSAEYLLDVSVLAALLTTVESPEVYEQFFNWTLVLCGIELLWTWIGALIWPAEALHSTYPARLVGVFPIQSANAIGASGAILAVVAFSRLLPLAGCKFQKSWNILLLGFGVASMVACQTRTAYAGFLVGVFLVFVFSRRVRIVALGGALLGLATYTVGLAFGAVAQPEALWDRIAGPSGAVLNFVQRGQSTDQLESLTGRTEWWTLAWQQFIEHPFTGLGAYAGGKFAVLSKAGFGDTPQLHSDYLETLVGTSIWGLIPLLAALFGTWWLLVRFLRMKSLNPSERQLAMEAIAVLGVISVRSLLNVELIWHAPQFFLAVLGYAELLRRRFKAAGAADIPQLDERRLRAAPVGV